MVLAMEGLEPLAVCDTVKQTIVAMKTEVAADVRDNEQQQRYCYEQLQGCQNG